MAKIKVTNPKQIINGGAKKYYFKVKGVGGIKGDKGDKGDTGSQGPQGPQGNAATIMVGSTTTLPTGYDATVTNTGTINNAILNFGIPRGIKGDTGAKGDKGDKGDKGEQGNTGPQGPAGQNATVYIGTTTTGAPGTQASVYNSGTDRNATLNFTIPRGATGATGATGPQGPAGQDGQNFTPTIVETLPATGDQSKLYLTPKNYTTGTATGNPITISLGEDAGQITNFQLDGDTYQQSYTGKNLFDKDNATIYKAYIWTTEFVMRNTYTDRTFLIPCLPNTTYTVSRSIKTTSFRVSYLDSDVVIPEPNNEPSTSITYTCGQYVVNNDGTSLTITTGANANRLIVHYGNTTNDANINESLATVQVEVGSSATSFEPYVGGVPSPNPDYPQQIQTVTGEQTVEVVGKNLFSSELVQGYYAFANGSYSSNSSSYVTNKNKISVTAGQTYTISANKGVYVGSDYTGAGVVFFNNGNYVSSQLRPENGTFTVPSGANQVVYNFYKGNSDASIAPSDITWTQLELGSTATTYTPYSKQALPISLGSIELCKLGTYQDYIYKSGSDWKVHKATKSITITGAESETWTAQTTTNNYYSYRLTVSDADKIASSYDVALAKSDCFTSGKSSDLNTATSGYNIYQLTVTGYLRFFTGDATNKLTDFKAMLAQKTPKVVYPLTTPTETTITDQTLISQLEAVRTASLQASNTITNTATGSNLAGDMELGYYEYDPTNRYDKWLWLDLNNNYEKLGS